MQDLIYNTESSSLVLVKENNQNVRWDDVSSLVTSASLLQIIAFSGSTVLANFPVNSTNILYYSNLTTSSIPTSSFTNLKWKFDDINSITGSYNIFDSSSSTYYISQSGVSNKGNSVIKTGNNYQLYAISSGSYNISITLNDITSGSMIVSSSAVDLPVSISFTPQQFHNYEATFSLISSL